VAALNTYIGYDEAVRVAKIALKTRRMICEVALSECVIAEAQLSEVRTTGNLVGIRK
jgi:aspartate ammonia-lyase